MNKNKNILITIAIVLSIIFAIYSVNKYIARSNKPTQLAVTDNLQVENKINISASFYPLADLAKNIGGKYVSVTNVTPAGVEPHDYEPTAKDIAGVYNASLFILNGNGVDGWAEKIRSDLESKGIPTIQMSENLDSIANNSEDEDHLYDPHFWLDPINVITEAELVYNKIVSIDPEHKAEYTINRDSYIKKLVDLNSKFVSGLSSCKSNTIVTSHNAFNYMANRYNFRTLYILGLSPEEEPSAQTIAQVAKDAKEKQIKYIFFESLISPKLSETIAKEIGAQTLALNPIEGLSDEEVSQGKNYITEMENNLSNLRIALECK